MASSSSSSSPSTWKYFISFHGPDVRKTFLSHLCKQLDSNEIPYSLFFDEIPSSLFDDSAPLFFDEIPSALFDDSAPLLKKQRSSVFHQRIERSPMIASELTQAIRESRISIIVLSKNYASSSKCLDELLEILKCKKINGQRVATVFYGVDPSDVQKQTGDFGIAFNETCAHNTEEERRRWRQALNDVGNIPGEHLLNCDNESKMIEKISRDMSNELNTTISRDFGDVVGLETHLKNIESLLHLDNEDEAMIVGIYGPAGIGKTIIARASYSRFSSSFQLTCFMGNLRGSYNSGLDEYGLELGVKRERLWDQKVLIILDNVDDLKQLEAWANEIKWFGPGSRIVVTTENQELLQKHGINDTYHVDFPSSEEALQILCKYAFGQRSPHNGFTELAKSVVDLCGNLPSRLSEVGSSLHGRKEEEWEKVIRRLALSNKRKSISIVMVFLVVINLLLEIASAVVEHLSSIQKPYFARISVVMSFLSVILSILDLIYKIRAHKACLRCKWPIPWFYYPDPGYNRISGNFTDTVLLFCVVGGSIVSTVNWSFIERRQEGPIKASVWPLFFAIGLVGMVVYKFIQEKLAICLFPRTTVRSNKYEN